MSLRELGIRLLLVHCCWLMIAFRITLNAQPACNITGGSDVICSGNSTTWSAPEGMATYYWTGPSGFTAFTRDITISIPGDYTVTISDMNGTNSCSGNLTVNPELLPGSINTDPETILRWRNNSHRRYQPTLWSCNRGIRFL